MCMHSGYFIVLAAPAYGLVGKILVCSGSLVAEVLHVCRYCVMESYVCIDVYFKGLASVCGGWTHKYVRMHTHI